MNGSPFTSSRFEYEPRHLYYLPQHLFARLEEARPTFLVGSRGTGKTTLLQALNWKERLHNDSLRTQLSEDPFSKRYIGVYIKLPEIQLEAMDKWLEDTRPAIRHNIVSLFLDLSWVKVLADAINELLATGVFAAPPEYEHACVGEVFSKYGMMMEGRANTQHPTLLDLSRFCDEKLQELQQLAMGAAEVGQVVKYLPIDQVGHFGRFVSPCLAKICDYGAQNHEGRWHFKVCMDEGECLSTEQLAVVKTIVRLAKWPAFPIAAFVSLPEDLTSTLIRKLTLQQADRELIILDDVREEQFKELAQGVATIRTRWKLRNEKVEVDVGRILGDLDINSMLYEVLSESVNKEAKALLEKSKALKDNPFLREWDGSASTKGKRVIPIYQTYLIQTLGLEVPSPEEPGWKKRKQDCAEIRKRMVAAYLSICSQYSRLPQIMYASGDVLCQLSDNCVRDFLSQIEEIYREAGRPLDEFVERKVSLAIQGRALWSASKKKAESIPRRELAAPREVGRLVKGLAQVTANIQSASYGNQHLRSSERGLFHIRLDGDDQAVQIVKELIYDAAQAGFLRLWRTEGGNLTFRVHTSLAAYFGFSYRGAYYPCALTVGDVDRLRTADGDEALACAVDELTRKLQQEPDMPLFKGIMRDG